MSDNKLESKDLVITRTFEAPLASVWDMWVNPKKFQQWYGPKGAKIPTAVMDVRVGGKRHICMEMTTPKGVMQMWFVGEYLEVEPMTWLSYTEVMSDEQGNHLPPSAMGMPGDEPHITTVSVRLTELGNSTQMVMTHAGIPADSPGATGWNMAIEKLEDLLNS